MPFGVGAPNRRWRSIGPALTLAGLALLAAAFAPVPATGDLLSFPGGFLETATTGAVRPRLTREVLQGLLPARGEFLFPAPYGTAGVRLTNADDCGGADCVNSVGYSYWRNINNHTGGDDLLVVLGLDRGRGGAGPTLFRYHKPTGQVTNAGPLFDSGSALSWHSTEGWYFSATRPTTLYLNSGSRMLRYDVASRVFETVFDVAPPYGSDTYLWQMHSSDDDRVHSATLRSSTTYEMLGCVLYQEDPGRFSFFPKLGDFDECHVDKSGRWLLILDDADGQYGADMRVVDVATMTERVVYDQNGAVGHADLGHGYVVGSDNWNSLPGAWLLWDFAHDPLAGSLVWHTLHWTPAPNHLAHGNARPDLAPAQQYACGSGASRTDAAWANEIICFRLDGSLVVLVVAPVMTDLDASGGGADDYARLPKGNLDVTGQYFVWTSNAAGPRQDAFLVKVPALLLMDGITDTTPPAIASVTATDLTAAGATITWTTDEAADSQVEYGPTTAYGGTTPLDATLVTGHAQSLAGLAPGTLYHFRVASRDAAGNRAVSADSTFTTPSEPSAAATGPIGHWQMTGGSGATTADASGNGFTASLLNGPAWIPGPADFALAFDGADDYAAVPHAPTLNPYPLTLAAWVRTTATGLHGVVNKYLPASLNGYQIFVNAGRLCAWYFKDAGNYVWDGSGCSLATPGYTDGLWHHVALVVDDQGGRLYVDGALHASRPWTGSPGPPSTTTDLAFARYPGVASPLLPGAIDDVRLYDRPLSSDEIGALLGPGDDPAGRRRPK
jgi:hypothetical protein